MPAGGRSSLRPGVRGKPRRGRVGPGRAHSLASPGIGVRCSLDHGSSRTIMGIALTHAGGVGEAGRSVWGACRQEARARDAGEKQGGWSVRDRGGGTRSPAPRAASPRGDISTVQHMGRSRRRPEHGCTPGIAPGTAVPLISPRTDPAPERGRGRSAEGAGRVGAADRSLRVSLRGRGKGGGCRQKRMLNQQEARARDAGEK